ncbi:hypothetical protein [Marichromatium sp. AB32]|uniref:hypothetical protein n=1 Tax=Marichromatium sp. AB32 TaxID=2483363 RepID=UPI0016816F7A|nr:hypothetical protein [Marichromatium sp. AB32]
MRLHRSATLRPPDPCSLRPAVDARDYADTDSQLFETHERRHGRSETRRYRTLAVPTDLPCGEHWPGLRTLGMVESERTASSSVASTLMPWGIENTLHWSLDVTFGDVLYEK